MISTSIRRLALLSVHNCPLASPGSEKNGGMGVYLYDLAHELGRRGIQVDVFTRSSSPDLPRIKPFFQNSRIIHIVAGPEVFLTTHEIFHYLPDFVRQVFEFGASESIDYDMIYSHYWLSGFVAHHLSIQWKIPFVQMFHTLGHIKNTIAQTPEEHEPDIRITTETNIMVWADHLIASNPADRDLMIERYHADKHKIAIISPGVNLSRFHPVPENEAKAALGLAPSQRMFLFVGRIEPLK